MNTNQNGDVTDMIVVDQEGKKLYTVTLGHRLKGQVFQASNVQQIVDWFLTNRHTDLILKRCQEYRENGGIRACVALQTKRLQQPYWAGNFAVSDELITDYWFDVTNAEVK